MENYENVKRSKKEMIFNNFLGGIFWGLGATLGATILLAILGFVLAKINLVPIVGDFVSQVTNFVLQNNTKLIK